MVPMVVMLSGKGWVRGVTTKDANPDHTAGKDNLTTVRKRGRGGGIS